MMCRLICFQRVERKSYLAYSCVFVDYDNSGRVWRNHIDTIGNRKTSSKKVNESIWKGVVVEGVSLKPKGILKLGGGLVSQFFNPKLEN